VADTLEIVQAGFRAPQDCAERRCDDGEPAEIGSRTEWSNTRSNRDGKRFESDGVVRLDGKFVTIEQAEAERDRCLKLLVETRMKLRQPEPRPETRNRRDTRLWLVRTSSSIAFA
jgi:hypothetical protein